MYEREILKEKIIKFYKKERTYDWLALKPYMLGIPKWFDRFDYGMIRKELREELLNENKLRVPDLSKPYILEYVQPRKDYEKISHRLTIVSIILAIISILEGLVIYLIHSTGDK